MNKFKHKDVGEQITYNEYHATDSHEADGQTNGDVLYFDGTNWIRKPATDAFASILSDPHQILVTNGSGIAIAITLSDNTIVGKLAGSDITDLDADAIAAILGVSVADLASAVSKMHDEKTGEPTEFVSVSAGSADAGKGIVLDANGELDSSVFGDLGVELNFTELKDVPQSYEDHAEEMVAVNSGETGLGFTIPVARKGTIFPLASVIGNLFVRTDTKKLYMCITEY